MGKDQKYRKMAGTPKTLKEFVIEDVRCFQGRNVFQIRPLTFLVGENSTGKSTVLGCLQALMDTLTPRNNLSINFNTPPYTMGSFADIARLTNKRAAQFKLGCILENEQGPSSYNVTLGKREGGLEPFIKKVEWIFPEGQLIAEHMKGKPTTDYKTVDGKEILSISYNETSPTTDLFNLIFLNDSKISERRENLMIFFIRVFEPNYYIDTIKVKSFAPIRTRPKRTYDPLQEDDDPEGSDMPMVLMNMHQFNKKQWITLKKRLKKFGETSNLFSDISIKQSKDMGGSFQLKIKVQGPSVNITDVGYGVSQILPILVRILKTENRTNLPFTTTGSSFTS